MKNSLLCHYIDVRYFAAGNLNHQLMRQTDDRFMAGMNGCVLDTVLIRTIGIRHVDAAILNDHFVVAFSVIDLNGTGLIQGIRAVDLTANCDGDGCSGLMLKKLCHTQADQGNNE